MDSRPFSRRKVEDNPSTRLRRSAMSRSTSVLQTSSADDDTDGLGGPEGLRVEIVQSEGKNDPAVIARNRNNADVHVITLVTSC
jgi:hypothetical protein